MNLVRYKNVTAQYRPWITTDMLMAKQGCSKCFGRGHRGMNLKTGNHVPCNCVMVDMDKLKSVVDEKAKVLFDTNIPSLAEQEAYGQ
jgi:hypothetical protein